MAFWRSRKNQLGIEIERLKRELDAAQIKAKTLESSNEELSHREKRLKEQIAQLQQMVGDSWGENSKRQFHCVYDQWVN